MYTLNWNPEATSSSKLAKTRFPRWQDVINGLEWGLSRKPWSREKIAGTDLRVWTMGPLVQADGNEFIGKFFFELKVEDVVSIDWIEIVPINPETDLAETVDDGDR
ncbi:hypothetical protein JIN84_09380 [Luteolibacter yonseiensis]|uniref:Uncharacterized protein n=1 Tax=Luteolibacter yonseiensis TaxID=1144680 RepID=A0A934VA44_9BACT|nr:hypothetical protein [Luteolibacter yonseiensis]MBK1815828.1 hypothetical protein [Luteolibacter yonseiensis]